MIEKIKRYYGYLSSLALLILGALLFRQKRVAESLESELASERTNKEIALNDQAREEAQKRTDELAADYKRKLDAYRKGGT
jgi:cell division protein ZapA (FtsZ GTPase activity inhibitor)